VRTSRLHAVHAHARTRQAAFAARVSQLTRAGGASLYLLPRDKQGYVYEKAAVITYIASKLKTNPNASGAVDSPSSGACVHACVCDVRRAWR
jgi:hypothetical protein